MMLRNLWLGVNNYGHGNSKQLRTEGEIAVASSALFGAFASSAKGRPDRKTLDDNRGLMHSVWRDETHQVNHLRTARLAEKVESENSIEHWRSTMSDEREKKIREIMEIISPLTPERTADTEMSDLS